MFQSLDDIAYELASRYDAGYEETLRIVTSYAIDLYGPEVGTQSGGQAPTFRVNTANADRIRRAYKAGRNL